MDEGPNDPNASKRDKAIANFLHALGWFGLYVGIAEPFIQYFIVGSPVSNPVACIAATGLGAVFHAAAYAWPPSKPEIRGFLNRLMLPIVRRRRLLAVIGILALWTILTFQIASIRGDLDQYAMPRTLSDRQTKDLKGYLATHGLGTPIVKVDLRDPEATAYASQIFNAIKSSWADTKFFPDEKDSEPKPPIVGVCIYELGTNAKSSDPKNDQAAALRNGFKAANIAVDCGSTVTAGANALYVLVGKRPLLLHPQLPFLVKAGKWLEAWSGYN